MMLCAVKLKNGELFRPPTCAPPRGIIEIVSKVGLSCKLSLACNVVIRWNLYISSMFSYARFLQLKRLVSDC